jgi:hypothetical protein
VILFKVIPVKTVASNFEIAKKINVNFEGLEVHLLIFLKHNIHFNINE